MVFFKKIIVNKIWKGESKLEGLNAPMKIVGDKLRECGYLILKAYCMMKLIN